MRLTSSAFALLAFCAVAPAQVWDKPIVPGLTYHMEYDATAPRLIYALRFSPTVGNVKAMPELGQGKVYADDDTKGRATVSEMVARTGAIAGINGDFFPFTGRPLGLMVRDGQLISEPVKPRAAFGWGGANSAAGIINWHITVTAEGQAPLDLDGIDQQCGPNCCVVNDPSAGFALSQKPATCVVIKVDKPMLGAEGQFDGVVQNLFADSTSVPLGPDALVMMGEGTKAAYLNALQPGQKVSFNVQTDGLDLDKLSNVIGGGPMLVQNGHAFVDWQDEGFKPDFAQKRHPRSAIGHTKDGDIWVVAVDGRQNGSVGATLDEMAAIMLKLGCVDAINMDGGGSTDMNLFGMVLNRPTEKEADQEKIGGTERKVANGILFYADPVTPSAETLQIVSPKEIHSTDSPDLKVVADSGGAVSNTDIIWSASGAAFIDQGGRIHVTGGGLVTVMAHVHGQMLTANLNVVGALTPDPISAPGKPAGKQGKP